MLGRMKKLAALSFLALTLLSLAGCPEKTPAGENPATGKPAGSGPPAATPAPAKPGGW
jgi:hypothetical protein